MCGRPVPVRTNVPAPVSLKKILNFASYISTLLFVLLVLNMFFAPDTKSGHFSSVILFVYVYAESAEFERQRNVADKDANMNDRKTPTWLATSVLNYTQPRTVSGSKMRLQYMTAEFYKQSPIFLRPVRLDLFGL